MPEMKKKYTVETIPKANRRNWGKINTMGNYNLFWVSGVLVLFFFSLCIANFAGIFL